MATEKLSSSDQAATADQETNWLDGDHSGKWKTMTLKGDMENTRERDIEERVIRAYLRGWLDFFNHENKTEYKVKGVKLRNNYGEDTRFTVKAFIDPPPTVNAHVEGNGHNPDHDSPIGGAHLIPLPPPPPPPGEEL